MTSTKSARHTPEISSPLAFLEEVPSLHLDTFNTKCVKHIYKSVQAASYLVLIHVKHVYV
jgi:hypothetical protein